MSFQAAIEFDDAAVAPLRFLTLTELFVSIPDRRLRDVWRRVLSARCWSKAAAKLAAQAVNQQRCGLFVGAKSLRQRREVVVNDARTFDRPRHAFEFRHPSLHGFRQATRHGKQYGPARTGTVEGHLGICTQIDRVAFQIAREGVESHVVAGNSRFIEFPPLGETRSESDDAVSTVLRVIPRNHLSCVDHRTVSRRQVLQEFGLIDLQVSDDCRTWLRDDEIGLLSEDVLGATLSGEFGSITDVEHCLNAEAPEPTIELQVLIGKVGDDRRSHQRHHRPLSPEVLEKYPGVVNAVPSSMGARRQTTTASNAEIRVDTHVIATGIIAQLDRTNGDALVAVDAGSLIDSHCCRETTDPQICPRSAPNSHLRSIPPTNDLMIAPLAPNRYFASIGWKPRPDGGAGRGIYRQTAVLRQLEGRIRLEASGRRKKTAGHQRCPAE